MSTGLLISFEGVDGCGKSTQVARLAQRLTAAGHDVIVVREPGGTTIGERVRALVLDPEAGVVDPAAEALLYAASRAQLVSDVIEPALAAGRVVIVDRYVDSSLAYQGAGRGLGVDAVLEANLLATRGRLPDLTLLLEAPLAIAAERRRVAGEPGDRIELAGNDFFERVHAAYGELAERWPRRIQRIDATPAPDAVASAIALAVHQRLQLVPAATTEEAPA